MKLLFKKFSPTCC